jgi:hypothetical protein
MSFVTCQVIDTGMPGMPASTEHLSVSPSTSILAGVAVYVTSKVRMPDGLQTSVMGTRLVGSTLHMASTAYARSSLLHRMQALLGAGEGDGLGAGDGDAWGAGDGLGEEGDDEGVGATFGTLNVNSVDLGLQVRAVPCAVAAALMVAPGLSSIMVQDMVPPPCIGSITMGVVLKVTSSMEKSSQKQKSSRYTTPVGSEGQ